MAFDGITTACLVRELSDRLTGGRIYKIAQTDKDELTITIKPAAELGGGRVRLYLCADPSLPLAYLTEVSRKAPLQAPSFCMLLRKHLQNGRIISVTQPGLERIIRIEAEHMDEMGDLKKHILAVELMGKHSNIIFMNKEGVITNSIKHISSLVSSVREVLPGRPYFIPDTQNKRDPLREDRERFLALVGSAQTDTAKLLVRTYTGLSPQIAEELCDRAGLTHDRSASSIPAEEAERLWLSFDGLMRGIEQGDYSPTLYYKKTAEGRRGAPAAYAAVPLTIYADHEAVSFASMSELLETFYAQKNADTRIRQKSADLRRIVQTILERDIHKYDLQCRQLKDTEKRDKFKLYGELLNTYSYSIPSGAKSCEVENYYNGETVRITLDPTLTPSQNAVRYYDRYTKLKRTAEALESLTVQVKEEIDHLESIRTALSLSTSEGDLAQIRQELEQTGLVRKHTSGKGKKGSRIPISKPLHYVSSDGYDLYVGKNNLQNDELTFRFSAPSDIWFHAKDIAGSHVILCARGQKMNDIPDRVFEEAASLAAWYSAGRSQEKVEVSYLERRGVKKPGGARPGFVIYHSNYSITARTDISGLKEISS